jgi:hypothetical protein
MAGPTETTAGAVRGPSAPVRRTASTVAAGVDSRHVVLALFALAFALTAWLLFAASRNDEDVQHT